MPISVVSITDRDTGLKKFELDLKHLAGRSVKVGIMGSESHDGVSVVDYAFYNEFGTSRIPARPFMSTTYDKYHSQTEKFIEFMYTEMVNGKYDADHLLRVTGEEYQKRIQETIRDAKNWAEPNAPATIARKGSSSPLIDQGRMIQSVRYEVK